MAFIHNLSVFINSNNVQNVLVCTFVFAGKWRDSAVQLNRESSRTAPGYPWAVYIYDIRSRQPSDRFVKKKHWGSPTGKRVEAPQALTCNTNTGVRIDLPRSSNRRRLGGVKKNHWEGWTPQPPPPGKSDPAPATTELILFANLRCLCLLFCRDDMAFMFFVDEFCNNFMSVWYRKLFVCHSHRQLNLSTILFPIFRHDLD